MKHIWYEADYYFRPSIKMVMVERETKAHVILSNGDTRRKRTPTVGFFETCEEAKSFLLKIGEEKLEAAESRRREIASQIMEIKKMNNDEEG